MNFLGTYKLNSFELLADMFLIISDDPYDAGFEILDQEFMATSYFILRKA